MESALRAAVRSLLPDRCEPDEVLESARFRLHVLDSGSVRLLDLPGAVDALLLDDARGGALVSRVSLIAIERRPGRWEIDLRVGPMAAERHRRFFAGDTPIYDDRIG
jgi:hypothetical protein